MNHSMLLLLSLWALIPHAEPQTTSPKIIAELIRSSNKLLKKLPAPYSEYSCTKVSYDDVERCEDEGGELSVWGPGITDTRLRDKAGNVMYTLRPDNKMEKLGRVRAEDISLVVGNDKLGSLKEVTLKKLLKQVYVYAWYLNVTAFLDLYQERLDNDISIRFQTTFLPLDDEEGASLEFVPESYNYNTVRNDDPKNMIIVATTQGVSFYQDTVGYRKLYFQEADDNARAHLSWYKVERTKYCVGEEIDEHEDLARHIGIPAMGKKFNAMMTIQVPLKQSPTGTAIGNPANNGLGLRRGSTCGGRFGQGFGQANIARLSKGSEKGIWKELLQRQQVQRDDKQRITITVVLYNTVTGGYPSATDMTAAIKEMEGYLKTLGSQTTSTRVSIPCSDLDMKTVEDKIKVVPKQQQKIKVKGDIWSAPACSDHDPEFCTNANKAYDGRLCCLTFNDPEDQKTYADALEACHGTCRNCDPGKKKC